MIPFQPIQMEDLVGPPQQPEQIDPEMIASALGDQWEQQVMEAKQHDQELAMQLDIHPNLTEEERQQIREAMEENLSAGIQNAKQYQIKAAGNG